MTMSGCPGDSAGTQTVNWISYPWHPDGYAVLDAQWDQAIDLWGELSEFARQHGVTRIALELIPLKLAYKRPDAASLS
ncbi:hypothetical protein [Amycolatopsis alkalitolerans]|uniref:hypothetical protein n=1 Tax=Amycolatopsis alkalitolerans TaxID=2547244 RepID=UPI00135BB571|nr:hypothetical protein [Amycolatopsis alkalitolerans]